MAEKRKADKLFTKNSIGGNIINARKDMESRLNEIMGSTRPTKPKKKSK